MRVETAGAYCDNKIPSMRHALKKHLKELPVSMIGGVPHYDREDIDRLCLNLKGR
jgi:hypothetical protein